MRRLIALDTNILLYDIQPPGQGEPAHVAAWRRDIQALLARPDLRFAIPAPALGEFLSHFGAQTFDDVAEHYEGHFETIPYNSAAARWASRLFHQQAHSGLDPDTRAKRKTDIEILACALAAGAFGLCTTHPALLDLPHGHRLLVGLPEDFVNLT